MVVNQDSLTRLSGSVEGGAHRMTLASGGGPRRTTHPPAGGAGRDGRGAGRDVQWYPPPPASLRPCPS